MLDENGTEATREDAQSAAESFFGDTAAATSVPITEEQEAEKVTGQERQDPHEPEKEASPSEELKVVVSIKDGRATIGVQRPSSDPHIESFDEPDLSRLAGSVAAVLERARARWENEPKYPTHERPAPSNRRRPRREQGTAQNSTDEGEAAQEQPETLRLF